MREYLKLRRRHEVSCLLFVDLFAPFLQFFWPELSPARMVAIVMSNLRMAVKTKRDAIVLDGITFGIDVMHLNIHSALFSAEATVTIAPQQCTANDFVWKRLTSHRALNSVAICNDARLQLHRQCLYFIANCQIVFARTRPVHCGDSIASGAGDGPAHQARWTR